MGNTTARRKRRLVDGFVTVVEGIREEVRGEGLMVVSRRGKRRRLHI